jgi:hypothetical protein
MPTPGGSVRPEQLRVRQNDPSSISGLPTTSDQRPPTRVPTWVWSGALIVLMVLTSLAVASVSVWLLLPYFALMALILFTPAGRGEREMGCARESETGSVGGEELADERAGAWVEGASDGCEWGESSAGTDLVVEPAEVAASDSESRAVKTKRGKGRMRKSKAVAESLRATATWIQVGPGKFVRAENPGPAVAAAFSSSEGEVPGIHEGEPTDSPPPSSGTAKGPVDAALLLDRDGAAEAPFGGVETPLEPSEEGDKAIPSEPTVEALISMDAGGDPEQAPGPEHEAESASAGVVELGSHSDADAPPPADVSVECGAGAVESEADGARDAEGQELAEVGETMVAGEIPATDLGIDADLEYDPGAVADAARDNGIAPDAFAETTGDNGIAPDAFVDVPTAGIETEDASPQDRGESPIAPDDFSGRSHRSTIGTLQAFWRRRGPHSSRATPGRSGPGATSTRRFVRPGRRNRVSPGLRRPSRRATGRSRQSCRTFPPRSPPCLRLDFEPVKNHGDGLGAPFGKTEGTSGPSP